ncbi:hypothetical protein Leryth_007196 [Lithospermum erythrorhizon]|uniref:Membrane-associated kinase regulator 6 n=1 Tax=Lithospermum erythrorhizon TaxID=34254 RepID=A0AAV3Q3S3_LITER|nr:hypothetical protein Leryth_007196 [Lithospermum erythrorhizon]
MENPQSLAIESFSYSWLIDKNQPPISDVCNNNEVKHHLDKNFNFDIPLCNKSPVSLVDANDIFSDGYMMPSPFLSRSRTQPSTSAPATPFFSFSMPSDDRCNSQSKFIKKWKKSSTKVLQKCSLFLRPICRGLSFPRKSNRVDDLGRKVWEVQSWGASLKTPPRSSMAYSAVDWAEMEKERRKSLHSYSMQSSPSNQAVKSYYDVDSESIKEAILHCKRSFA